MNGYQEGEQNWRPKNNERGKVEDNSVVQKNEG